MSISHKYDKHFEQIKRGGTLVVVKKIRSLIYSILQSPIYLISFPNPGIYWMDLSWVSSGFSLKR